MGWGFRSNKDAYTKSSKIGFGTYLYCFYWHIFCLVFYIPSFFSLLNKIFLAD